MSQNGVFVNPPINLPFCKPINKEETQHVSKVGALGQRFKEKVMKEVWNFDCCVSVLTGEIGLLKKISAIQDKIRQAVMNRDWDEFDEKTREINQLSEEFAGMEDERARLFSALTNTSNKDDTYSGDKASAEGNTSGRSSAAAGSWVIEERPFYAAIMPLPAGERRELANLYRELKMETLKMKASNETFLTYLEEAKAMASAYIEAACPARGGKLYTRKGRRVSQDLKSIVINNRF